MIIVRDYRGADAYQIHHRDEGARVGVIAFVRSSVAFTVVDDGTPIGVFGYASAGPQMWDCWASFSDQVRGRGLALTKACRKAIKQRTQGKGVRRAQVLVDIRCPEYKRWAELLGFREESRMRNVLPHGGDAYMMVYFPEDHINGR